MKAKHIATLLQKIIFEVHKLHNSVMGREGLCEKRLTEGKKGTENPKIFVT